MTKKKKLSKKSSDLIEDFSKDAMSWGWEQDMGTGKAVDNAEKNYKQSRAELEAHILKLEQQIVRLKKPVDSTKWGKCID